MKKYIKFVNSWSTAWGDKGFGYMGEDYMKWLQAAFVLTDNFIIPMFDLVKTATRAEQYLIINGGRYWILNERDLQAPSLVGRVAPLREVSEAELLEYPDCGVIG